jgi:hypothetical protein
VLSVVSADAMPALKCPEDQALKLSRPKADRQETDGRVSVTGKLTRGQPKLASDNPGPRRTNSRFPAARIIDVGSIRYYAAFQISTGQPALSCEREHNERRIRQGTGSSLGYTAVRFKRKSSPVE